MLVPDDHSHQSKILNGSFDTQIDALRIFPVPRSHLMDAVCFSGEQQQPLAPPFPRSLDSIPLHPSPPQPGQPYQPIHNSTPHLSLHPQNTSSHHLRVQPTSAIYNLLTPDAQTLRPLSYCHAAATPAPAHVSAGLLLRKFAPRPPRGSLPECGGQVIPPAFLFMLSTWRLARLCSICCFSLERPSHSLPVCLRNCFPRKTKQFASWFRKCAILEFFKSALLSRRWSGNGKSAVFRQQESVSDTKRNCYALTTAGEYKSARHYKQRQAQRRQPQEQQRPSPTPPTLASASLNIKVTSINAAQLDPSAARHKWRGDPPPSDSIQAPNGSPVGGRGGG
ncbi:hypothetical protein IWZ01DRAFT_527300 [Phyllosticta capitalensis]